VPKYVLSPGDAVNEVRSEAFDGALLPALLRRIAPYAVAQDMGVCPDHSGWVVE